MELEPAPELLGCWLLGSGDFQPFQWKPSFFGAVSTVLLALSIVFYNILCFSAVFDLSLWF